MADVVEASLDVAFKHPLGGFSAAEPSMQRVNRILTASVFSEAVGVLVGCRLGYRFQGCLVQGLHRPVLHGRDAERSLLAVLLRYVHSFQRFWLVSPTPKGAYGPSLCRIRLPGHPVHSCGSLSFIGCHPRHRQCLGGSACDEKMLQGFHLIILLLSLCLCDSPLQLAYPPSCLFEFFPRPDLRLG